MGETGSEGVGPGWIFQGMTGVSERGAHSPEAGDASLGAKMAFRRTVGRVIPWSGCVPAEPASVSPGGLDVPHARPAYKSKQAQRSRSDQRMCLGHEGRTGCSEGMLVFCLDNGVHYSVH